MGEVGDAVQLDFKRNGDLLLDFFRGVTRPLGDDLRVGVGDVGVSLDGQGVERDDAPGEKHDRSTEHEQGVCQGEVDGLADHPAILLTSSRRLRWKTRERS